MRKSNIYLLVELEKFLKALASHHHDLQKAFLVNAAYFQILEPDYFSDNLLITWKDIVRQASGLKDPFAVSAGVLKNQIMCNISQMSEQECYELAMKINNLSVAVNAELKEAESYSRTVSSASNLSSFSTYYR
ncbi:hypothetical protein [Telluribacter sp. SYSU D00476]|uniref:hypothetical protein n=1 Tax=Telluribacter sp. SYSU D00476 TaxID=2811430 RepID=UPI001FF6F9EF|nr:hypothetical protein [Telluribacter sp. SYSU D00476]